MQTNIINIRDRSHEFNMEPGSAVQFTYIAEAAFKRDRHSRAERFHFKSRLWIDFNHGRFLFSDRPEQGNWEYCSIAGNINQDKEIEIFPCDNDTFMCSFVLRGLNPRSFTRSKDYDSKVAKLMFRGPQGFILDDKMAFITILDHQDLQHVHDIHRIERDQMNKRVWEIIGPQLEAALNDPIENAIGEKSYCEDRPKEMERKRLLLQEKGTILRNFDGELVNSADDAE